MADPHDGGCGHGGDHGRESDRGCDHGGHEQSQVVGGAQVLLAKHGAELTSVHVGPPAQVKENKAAVCSLPYFTSVDKYR